MEITRCEGCGGLIVREREGQPWVHVSAADRDNQPHEAQPRVQESPA